MIATMERIEIVFMRNELSRVVDFLQQQGVVHLEQVPLAVEDHPGYLHRVHLPESEKREADRLNYLDQMLKEILPLLVSHPSRDEVAAAGRQLESQGSELVEDAMERHETHVRSWHREIRRLVRRRLNLQDDIALIQRFSALLREVQPLLQECGASLGENARAMILDAYGQEALDALRARIGAAAQGSARSVTRHLGKDRDALVVAFAPEAAAAVDEVLAKEGIRPISSPDGEHYGNTPLEVLERAGKRLAALQSSLDQLNAQIRDFSAKHGAKLVALSQIVSNRLKQLNASENFAQSKLIGVIHGWVPADELPALESALKKEFGDRAALGKLGFSDVELERVPTKRVNHPIVRPFELVMSMMKPPSYGHFDPTWIVGLSFLIFYGFVLGDAGYGLTMLAIGYFVKRKWGHIKALCDGMTILQYMGVSSIVFGIIYFEFFGNVLEHLYGGFPSFLFHRVYYPETSLMISVLFGVIHIPLSLYYGVREGYAHGHTKHAEEKLGMLLGLMALFVGVAAMGGMFPLGSTLGGVLAVLLFGAALFYLFKSMGAMGLMGVMEIIGLSANVLSYSRLMALGVAGVAFATIANSMPENATGFALFLFALLGAAGVHAFNFCLSVFSPTIHSLRLNVVEFLPKFYHPEGRNYEPFRKDMAW